MNHRNEGRMKQPPVGPFHLRLWCHGIEKYQDCHHLVDVSSIVINFQRFDNSFLIILEFGNCSKKSAHFRIRAHKFRTHVMYKIFTNDKLLIVYYSYLKTIMFRNGYFWKIIIGILASIFSFQSFPNCYFFYFLFLVLNISECVCLLSLLMSSWFLMLFSSDETRKSHKTNRNSMFMTKYAWMQPSVCVCYSDLRTFATYMNSQAQNTIGIAILRSLVLYTYVLFAWLMQLMNVGQLLNIACFVDLMQLLEQLFWFLWQVCMHHCSHKSFTLTCKGTVKW